MQNYSKEAIYDYLKGVMVDLFEIDESAITPDANLYEDLDIDSIDAVDLVVKLKEFTGKKIQPDDFKHVRTVNDVVEAVYKMLNDESGSETAAQPEAVETTTNAG
ncbi:acyl carrier protein [Teredinibacter turnerae]|uniref:Acyl carrier protein n=1 Tax=Teredinibacter turnerae (strain ATCC 39867 / T7901) TaxID=377629 RepID=C5BQ18_TERTT|nr:acyl carrier protein [Teredinibacter turnerae]ACR13618.1 Phosphopantetheine attachment site [Teredinibacter turnerae T7901]